MISSTRISGRCVLFDLDDTLLDHSGAARIAIEACSARWGLPSAPDIVERWRELERYYYQRFQERELTLQQQRRERIRAFLAPRRFGDAEAEALFEEYWSTYRASWSVFPDAVPCVERARSSGLIVALLTNGDLSLQAAKLADTGMTWPDVQLVASSELTAGKPSPTAFHEACGLVGARPDSSTTMVGDSLETDVSGALGAGLSAVLLDRSAGLEPPGGARRVGSLDELSFELTVLE